MVTLGLSVGRGTNEPKRKTTFGPDNQYLTSGFEYETIWGFGAGCTVDDLDIIAHIDQICDDLGLDTIEIAGSMMVAMEAHSQGMYYSFGCVYFIILVI